MVRKRGKVETRVSTAILLLLLVIAGGVFWKQSRYDPQVFRFSFDQFEGAPLSGTALQEMALPPLESFMPSGMLPFSAVEFFDSENLSDKINGKAEFYLPAGFKALVAQRFAAQSLPGHWMEVFLYDMGDPRNAFAVYSGQRRSGAQDLDLTVHAYGTDNAVFFTLGGHYVEIIASLSDPVMQEMMIFFARNMVSQGASQDTALREMDLLPEEGLRQDSVYLIAADAFGFDAFDNVFTAQYEMGRETATAFLSLRESPQEARSLAAGFADFLAFFGAELLPEASTMQDAVVLRVFDTYEVIVHHGRMVYGVHEAPDLETALELAERMHAHIRHAAGE